MSKTKEPTIREQFEDILNTYDLAEKHRVFLEGRIAVLERKSTERKPTARQLQNAGIAQQVYDFMEPGRAYTCGELLKLCPALANCDTPSASYANSIIKRLKDGGMVERTEVKGRAYFTKVEQE